MDSSFMASLDQELDICIHERDCHRHSRPIWQHKIGVVAKLLDHTENVIPSATIQPRTMITKFVDNLS